MSSQWECGRPMLTVLATILLYQQKESRASWKFSAQINYVTVWRFKLEGNFSIRNKVIPEGWAVTAQPSGTTLIRKAKWVKFIGCVFKSSLYQQKESRVFLIFSAHINIEVAPNCLAL